MSNETAGDAVGQIERILSDLKERAEDVLARRSRSYTHDAITFAPHILRLVALQRDYDLMFANLTATQERCTELFEENRRLRGEDS